MYNVWIDYKDGSRREESVSTAVEAEALRQEWEARGAWHDAGYCLLKDRE
jgi:hypothetical protein